MPPTTAPQPTIACPNCGTPVRLTEALAGPLVEQTRREYEQRLAQQQNDFAAREEQMKSVADRLREQQAQLATERARQQAEREQLAAAIEAQKDQLAAERERINEEVARRTQLGVDQQLQQRLIEERKTIAAAERLRAEERAQERFADELVERERRQQEKDERIAALREKLSLAETAQADLLQRQAELEDRERAQKLDMERTVQGRIDQVRAEAVSEAEERLGLQLKDRERKLEEMNSRIEELQRRAQVGSQQAQGETLELVLEDQLRRQFPFDLFQPVAKGESGADILQVVRDEAGRECGRILWELKRTKNWSPSWIAKLKGDQRNAQAELAVLISQAMPPDVQHFNEVDGVWVSSIACTVPVATAMRASLLQVGRHRRAAEGQQTKSELIYQYLTGPQFRARLEAISERWNEMRADLEAERKFALRQWAKREKQLDILLQSTAGINGDLQGIAGREMPEIEALAPTLLLE